jgi:serine/threonine protein kinase
MNIGARRLKPIDITAATKGAGSTDSKGSSTERSTMSDFKTLKKLGKGAFGEVFMVRKKDDGQTYALKKVGISRMSSREIADALNEIR